MAERIAGRVYIVATLILVALCGSVAGADASSTEVASARLVKPNVVLVLTDDQTMDAIARMPYVSGQSWITFTNAFVENALCCPSRASILQGRWDTHTGVQHNLQAANFDARETLPVWLQRAGYRTGLFGKYLNNYDGTFVPPGWNLWQVPFSENLYEQYAYTMSNNGTVERRGSAPADYQVDLLAARAVRFIAQRAAEGVPFFLYFAPTATHSPWKASPSREGQLSGAPVAHSPAFNESDVSDKPAYIQAMPRVDPATMDARRRKQWEASRSVDDAVRRIDGALRTAGVRDTTVVIFTTDNGYSFGDHRWVLKRCEYDECSQVPLLVRYPGQAARNDAHLVTNVDLASTIAQIAGAVPALPQDGRSLLPLISPLPGAPPPNWRTAILQHWPGGSGDGLPGRPDSIPQYWAVRTAIDKYVELDTGETEYYDEIGDPYELVNRASDPRLAARIAVLDAELDALKRRAGAENVPRNTSMPVPGPLGPDRD